MVPSSRVRSGPKYSRYQGASRQTYLVRPIWLTRSPMGIASPAISAGVARTVPVRGILESSTVSSFPPPLTGPSPKGSNGIRPAGKNRELRERRGGGRPFQELTIGVRWTRANNSCVQGSACPTPPHVWGCQHPRTRGKVVWGLHLASVYFKCRCASKG